MCASKKVRLYAAILDKELEGKGCTPPPSLSFKNNIRY